MRVELRNKSAGAALLHHDLEGPNVSEAAQGHVYHGELVRAAERRAGLRFGPAVQPPVARASGPAEPLRSRAAKASQRGPGRQPAGQIGWSGRASWFHPQRLGGFGNEAQGT